MYRHALATWDEPSLEEKKRAIGFQTSTTSHTKVIRLECNVLLGRGMDLNSLPWLLVTCVNALSSSLIDSNVNLR